MHKLHIFFIICFLFSCSARYSPEIKEVLQQAGDNRGELEKVLERYGKNPADSLKLRAAEFLIVNMPGKYSEYYDAPWNDVATTCLRWTSSSDKQIVLEAYRLGEPVKQEDVKYIAAEYLVNNIEIAFKVWREQPWGKYVPFDIFCEEILPYRVSAESLENWREKALASFADLNRSFKKDSTITAIEACSMVNALLPRFRLDKDFPPMNYSQLMASTRGSCDAMAALAVFSMRALGIPVTEDFTIQWPLLNSGHSWNAVCDSSGRHVSFMGTQSHPGQPHQGSVYTKSKAYRKMFARQNNIPAEEVHIPPALNNPHIKDISHEYAECADISVPVRFPATVHTGYAYLAALIATGEKMQWEPVAWGKVESRHIYYASVVKKLLYLPVYYADCRQTPAGYPFYLDESGNIRYFEADSSYRETVLYERGAYYNHIITDRMIQGRFEGANRRDFSDAQTLHVITAPMPSFNEVEPERLAAYRYVRYVSPLQGFCNVAEIEFYDVNGSVLKGMPIGTPGSYRNGMMTFEKAFDGNTATFYDALNDDHSWTGMDFGKRMVVEKIRYHPRENVMSIDSGQTCELFYWNGTEWQSLGEQVARDACLSFRVPGNALFYLRTVGEPTGNASVFAMENDKQKWLFKDVVNTLPLP